MNRVRHVFILSWLAFAMLLAACGGDAPEASVPASPTSPTVSDGPTVPAAANTTGPDLMIQKVTWTPHQPEPGESVHFNVTVGYQGSRPAGLFTISYFIDDVASGEDQVFQLEAGSSVTETFVRHAPDEEFVLRIEVDSKSKVAEIDESNNIGEVVFGDEVFLTIGGVRQPAGDSETVFLGPDLVISQMSWAPLNPRTGEAVSFNVTIKNQGDQEAEPFTVAYRIDGEQQSQGFVPGLAANTSANKTFSWRVLAIDYRVSVVADSEGTVAESDETNNQHEVVFSDKPFAPPPPPTTNTTGKADLLIDSITYTPEVPLPGEYVSFNATIRNRGDADAGSFLVNWYVTPVDAPQHNFQSFSGLGSGNHTLNMTFDWKLPAGDTNLLFIIDQPNVIDEQDESNNKFEVSFGNIELPDLVFTDLSLEPESVSVGESITLTAKVKNDAKTSVPGFWLSIYLDGKKTRTSQVNGIAAGGIASVSITWPAEAGHSVLEAVIDDIDEISERNEHNNREQIPLPEIRLPDLSVDEIIWSPLNPFANEPCDFSVTVRNAGSGDAVAAQFTLTIDGGLKQSRGIPVLAAGETWTTTYRWTAETGEHAVRASVDYGTAAEVSQQNNSRDIVFSHTVTPLPDLTVSSISLMPAAPAAGDTVALHIEVSNKGVGDASSSLLKCYIDDQLETSITVWTLEAGHSAGEVYYFTPTAGVHKIRIVVDALNSVVESHEDNNTREMQFTVSG